MKVNLAGIVRYFYPTFDGCTEDDSFVFDSDFGDQLHITPNGASLFFLYTTNGDDFIPNTILGDNLKDVQIKLVDFLCAKGASLKLS